MSRSTSTKMRAQLRAEQAEREQLMLQIAEAAQREAQLTTLLERRRKENEELKKSLDFQRVRLNGYQLELEARQYLLPFVKAQVDLLLNDKDVRFAPYVRTVMESVQSGIDSSIETVKPTLDPSSWLRLARYLGLGTDFQQRRTPARRTEPPIPTLTPDHRPDSGPTVTVESAEKTS